MVARGETKAQQRKALTHAGDNGRENGGAPADTTDTAALGNCELSRRNQKAVVDQKSEDHAKFKFYRQMVSLSRLQASSRSENDLNPRLLFQATP